MMTPIRRPRAESKRMEIERVSGQAAGDTWVVGRILVKGAGEVLVDIPFPVTFGERPIPILGGGEYASGEHPEQTRYPTATAIVIDWKTVSNDFYYKGATLAITTTGRTDQQLWVSFAFVGTALTNAATD